MALTKEQKTAQLNELVTKLKDSESVMFSNYIGLNVADVSELRNNLMDNGAEMKVAKKTLMKLAFKEAGLPDIEPDNYEGAIACIFSFEDPLSGAQTAFKFAKDHDQVKLVGGLYDGKLLTASEATELAQLPGREQLLAKFVGMLQSPLNTFAGMCSSPLSGFARALDQMAEKGGFAEAAPEPEAPKEEVKAETEEAPAEEPKAEEAAPAAEETPTEEPKPEEAPAESEATEPETSETPEEEKPEESAS